jgi:hypothetical protein
MQLRTSVDYLLFNAVYYSSNNLCYVNCLINMHSNLKLNLGKLLPG